MTKLEIEIADKILQEIKDSEPSNRGNLLDQYQTLISAAGARAGCDTLIGVNEMVAQAKRELAAIAMS